jgi:DEAD/DEAH box helicase domain-containing protein
MNSGDIVFDVETKRSFDEVGGRNNFDKLGVSVVGAYIYGENSSTTLEAGQYRTFEEHEIPEFEKLLLSAGRVIGFNINHFDYSVLKPYLSLNTKILQTLDLMDDVEKGAGFRISLDNLSEQTLGVRKSGDGMQAIRWFKDGKIEEIKKYCLKDVELTKNLYEYGIKNGRIFFYSKSASGKVSIPVNWKLEIRNWKLTQNVQPSIF